MQHPDLLLFAPGLKGHHFVSNPNQSSPLSKEAAAPAGNAMAPSPEPQSERTVNLDAEKTASFPAAFSHELNPFSQHQFCDYLTINRLARELSLKTTDFSSGRFSLCSVSRAAAWIAKDGRRKNSKFWTISSSAENCKNYAACWIS